MLYTWYTQTHKRLKIVAHARVIVDGIVVANLLFSAALFRTIYQ